MIESYERLVLRLVEEIGSLRAEIKGMSINTTAELKVASNEIRDREKLHAKLRSFRIRLSNSVSPNFLIFALSHGILNSRIYASS